MNSILNQRMQQPNPMAKHSAGAETMARMKKVVSSTGLVMLSCVMAGCGAGHMQIGSEEPGTPLTGPTLQGRVHGGQQAVSGATIQLYAAGTTGYASAATALLTTTVKTASDGSFSITGDYTCPTSTSQVYLTATGGNPGTTSSNANLAMMVALGSCSALQMTTNFIWVNEVTTVASVYVLAPFMSGPANVGSSSTNKTGLTQAMALVNQLANTTNGSANGTSVPSGAVMPTATVYSLANVLAACINSTGGAAGSSTPCGSLFTAATPSGGSAPADTITAALDIAQNPGHNVSTLYGLIGSTPPFSSGLTGAPNDWTLSASYPTGNEPWGVAVDGSGNVWVTNQISNSVTELASTGAPVAASFTTGISQPTGIAIAADGTAYVANAHNNTVAHLSTAGALQNTLTGGGLNSPNSVALDPSGNIWITNQGAAVISEFNGTSAVSSTGYSGTGIAYPNAVVVSNK